MAAPTAVRWHGISTGDEIGTPSFSPGGPGAFDKMTRRFLVDSSTDWVTAAAAINGKGVLDSNGRIGNQAAHANEMYCDDFSLAAWYGDTAEVVFSYKGRFDKDDDKKKRIIQGGAQTVTADDVDFTNGQLAIKMPPDPDAAQSTYSAWTRRGWGNYTDEAMAVSQGEIVLVDTWVSKDSNLQDFAEYVNFQRPDGTTTPKEPGDTGFMPGGSPITPPQNPWKSFGANYVINWPHGWVLQGRTTLDSAGSFSSGTPGAIHIIQETWRYVHDRTIR